MGKPPFVKARSNDAKTTHTEDVQYDYSDTQLPMNQKEGARAALKQKLTQKTFCEGQIMETHFIENLIQDWVKMAQKGETNQPIDKFLTSHLTRHRAELFQQVQTFSVEIPSLIRTLKS